MNIFEQYKTTNCIFINAYHNRFTRMWYRSAGANPFMAGVRPVSTLATAAGGERCLWDPKVLSSKPHPTPPPWSHIYSTASARKHMLMSSLYKTISMALCKTVVSPLPTHWRYSSLVLSHRFLISFARFNSYKSVCKCGMSMNQASHKWTRSLPTVLGIPPHWGSAPGTPSHWGPTPGTSGPGWPAPWTPRLWGPAPGIPRPW